VQGIVVIVDEDVNARIIAETLLQVRGIDARMAADGTEACEIVRRYGAAVVVVDLGSPGTNGIEAIRKLCGRFEALPLPAQPRIIALSSSQTPDLERFVLRLGADVLLRKPVVPAEFVLTVERLMQLPRLASAVAAYAS
jgi:two-component system sensor histidine kinase/response regulator